MLRSSLHCALLWARYLRFMMATLLGTVLSLFLSRPNYLLDVIQYFLLVRLQVSSVRVLGVGSSRLPWRVLCTTKQLIASVISATQNRGYTPLVVRCYIIHHLLRLQRSLSFENVLCRTGVVNPHMTHFWAPLLVTPADNGVFGRFNHLRLSP